MGFEYHRTDGIVFKAAIAIGFDFTQSAHLDEETLMMIPYGREALEDWLKEHGVRKATRKEADFRRESGEWVDGIEWKVSKGGGHFVLFYTHDTSHIRREMLRQRQEKAVAKAAPDPKTPPRTMGTRKDTI